ncbi:glycosyltransferase, partial [Carnobacterium divergens]
VKQLIKEENIMNVTLGGWIEKEKQQSILKASLLHLLPSYHEGLPMSILESMSYGIPNLTSNVGGIPQVVRDGENGMMVDPGNINEMFEKIVFFLENDKLRKSYSENAYQMIQEHFSIEAYFIKWNQLYKELLKVN